MVLGWGISTSFPWLFSLILKSVSVFPTYCFYITSIPSSIWHMWGNNSFREKSCFLSLVTLKVNVVVIWLQHRVLLFAKHGEHFPAFKVLLFILFAKLFSILLLPMSSFRFLLRLKAVTGSFSKLLFRIILLMFSKNRSYVIAKWIRVVIGVSFLLPLISSFLSSFSTVLMCLSSSPELNPYLRNRSLNSLRWCSKSFDVAQIRLICSAWLYGILSFNDFECSEFMWRNLCRLVCFLYILV